MCGNAVSDFTDDVLGFDPNGGGVFSVARDVLGDKIADDVLGMDPNGGGFIPVYNTAANIAVSTLAGDALGGLANMAGMPLELTDATSMSDLGYSGVAPDVITEVPMPDFELPSDLPLELTDTTSMADLDYSNAAPDVTTEVPMPEFNLPTEVPTDLPIGDQPGDYPLEGNYGNPTAPGVQDAVQNLLDTNKLQELTGSPLDVLGDQPGDYPTEGNYGNPTAPGVQEAVQNLLDTNAANAAAGLSAADALRLANQAKNFFLTGSPTGAIAGSSTGTTSSSNASGALPQSILDFTPHMTKGSQISLVGMPTFQETYTQTAPTAVAPSPQLENVQFAATGGLIQSFGDGGAPVSLDPRFTKGRKVSPSTFYGNLFPLTSPQIGMPTFKAYNEGGEVVDHQPQFYSEGGLGTLKNRYVKGPGDGTSDSVPAMLANGEFVIPADVVSKLGNGSNDAGAGILDKFLVSVRKHAQNHNPNKLPPDSKGPLAYLLEAKKKKA
jgi:hypothetical protein